MNHLNNYVWGLENRMIINYECDTSKVYLQHHFMGKVYYLFFFLLNIKWINPTLNILCHRLFSKLNSNYGHHWYPVQKPWKSSNIVFFLLNNIHTDVNIVEIVLLSQHCSYYHEKSHLTLLDTLNT